MLEKIINIKNVGLFKDAKCTLPAFDKVTLIYAGNGRGKSTLASILRSCSTNNTTLISHRQTLDSSNLPEIELLFKNGAVRKKSIFNEQGWSNPYSDILVFDTEFVDKNVYSGTQIGANHKQELLEFALGEDAVQLKQQVDSETQKISNLQKEVKNIERELTGYRKEMALKEFTKLPKDPTVDDNIKSLEARLNTAKNNETLQKKSYPKILTEPQLDIDEFFNIFFSTLEDIEQNAEDTIRYHINKHSDSNFENWLSQGQAFENNKNCPYCGQDLLNSDLLKAYKTYFNKSYNNLKSNVADLSQNIEKNLSETVIDKLVSMVEKNQVIANEWNEHIDSERFEFNEYELRDVFKQIKHLLSKLVKNKQQNPLEIVGSNSEKNQTKLLWDQALSEIRNYNQLIKISIAQIKDFKEKLASEDIQQIQNAIKKLNIVKVRQKQVVCNLIQEWKNTKKEKKLHEQQKQAAREELDTIMTQTLQRYQHQINTIVNKFGALFEICELNHDYRGTGLPRSDYGLKVKDQEVKLSANNAPSFSTALSEGDKRTLAFAFFIARIEADANLSSKIIVVDDPVCSLDRGRRTQTKRILRGIGRKSAQLIVLGHDSHFLRDLRDELKSIQVNISAQLFKINRVAHQYSNFSTFDIDKECASLYYKNHQGLRDFVDGQDCEDLFKVAKSIRPLLEGYLHRRFPGQIQRNKLFGQIIGDAKIAQLPNPLFYLQSLATELYEINEYAGQFHHDTNAASDRTQIDEAELLSYARRALNVIYKGTS